jgi:predicted SAM-dependent methyltransferase
MTDSSIKLAMRDVARRLLVRIPGGERFLKSINRREIVARQYLRGTGIEIGALNDALRLPWRVKVLYCDRAPLAELKRIHPGLPHIIKPDIVDDAECMATVADLSVDFIIANQCFEHFGDPIGALKAWLRILKPNGIIYMTIPDKRFTFDVDRPVTTLNHLLEDHALGPELSQRAHFEEISRIILGMTDTDEIERHAAKDIKLAGHTHYHVWSQTSLLEMIAALQRIMDIEVEAFVANPALVENIVVLRKGARGIDRKMATESLRLAMADHHARHGMPQVSR